MIKENRFNRYDQLLIILIALQAFGGIGGAFQPVRIFMMLFIPATINFMIKNKSILLSYKYEVITFYIWIAWGLFSLIWVINFQESLKEILYLILYFLSFFLVVFFSHKANNPKESIIKGWILLFLFTIPIALVEVIFDLHLPSAYQQENLMMNLGDGQFLQRRFASVTFGNLNGYNTLLVYITPFVAGNLIKSHSTYLKKIAAVALVTILIFLIIANSSRATILSLFIIFLVLLGYSIKNYKTFIGFTFTFIFCAGILLYFSDDFFKPIIYRMQEQGFEDNSRLNLIKLGLYALSKSYFFGVGTGNFSPTMDKIYSQELTVAHNFFLEVLIQYGIIIFILFIGMFIRIIRKNKDNQVKYKKFIITSSLLIYPITSIINSTYILSAWTWLFIASLYIISDKKYERAYG